MQDYFLSLNLVDQLLVGVFVLATIIQLAYYLVIYSRVAFYPRKKELVSKEPVSVVICARNEAENIKEYLPFVLQQNYPNYEVIVVNDRSQDKTAELLAEFKLKYSHLKTSEISEDTMYSHNKKLAVTLGVKAAQNELILFTDADCIPRSKEWINSMVRNFDSKTEIVLGYGGYLRKRGFVNQLIRFDTFFIALQYFSFALVGIPYMGVGRNMAYRKSLFFKSKGFASYANIISGDDDLFVNKNATTANVAIEIDAESIIRSRPKTTLGEWIRQKRRHITTGPLYKTKHKLFLGMELFSRCVFYILFVILLTRIEIYTYVLGVFGVRFLVQITLFKIAMIRLREKFLLVSSLILDSVMPFVYMSLTIVNLINSKQKRWK